MKITNVFTSRHLYKLYFFEKSKAKSEETLKKLHQIILEYKPNSIIAHSMGSFLLANYLEKFECLSNLQKVFLIQADVDANYRFKISKNVKIVNFHCFWDPALLYSWVLNWRKPAGIFGLKSAHQNIFIPLLDLPNPHKDILRNQNLKKKIFSI